jgi:penicillin-binding protein 1A
VAVDPRTGHVKAFIGGRNFEQSKFDRVRQARRQAGSSFKPFVYTAAIASGIPASHIVVDQPVVYPQVDGTEWRPRNFDPEFLGPITIRHGLRRSINMIAIKLGWEEVGIETVRQTARSMGIRTEIEPFPSTTIGAVEVIPLQLVEAYATFATLGTRVRPFPILRVESPEGEVLWEPQPERTQVLDSLVARIMVDMLQDAANAGTGANHHQLPGTLDRDGGGTHPRIPTAGKTGTTNDGTNTWFTGFTPNLAATVWFGMDQPQPMSRGRPQATGGFYAAPVWGRFVDHVYHGLPGDTLEAPVLAEEDGEVPSGPEAGSDETWAGGMLPIPEPWPIPVGLTTRQVDARSGKLWSSWCEDPEENRYTELYIPGTEPTEYCDDTDSTIFRIPGVDPFRPRGPRPPLR